MFRPPYQSPVVQGTTALPSAMQAPPALRLVGIDRNTAEEALLYQQFGSALRHFILAQRQNQAAGGLPVVRNTARGQYIDVTYARVAGVETITIVAKPPFLQLVRRLRADPDIVYETMLDGVVSFSTTNTAGRNGAFSMSLNGTQIYALDMPSTNDYLRYGHAIGFGARAFTLPRAEAVLRNLPDAPAYRPITPAPFRDDEPAYATRVLALAYREQDDSLVPDNGDSGLTWALEQNYGSLNPTGTNRLLWPPVVSDYPLEDLVFVAIDIEFYARSRWSFRPARKGWSRDVFSMPPLSQIFVNAVMTRARFVVVATTAKAVYLDFSLEADTERPTTQLAVNDDGDDVELPFSLLYARPSDPSYISGTGYWNEDTPP